MQTVIKKCTSSLINSFYMVLLFCPLRILGVIE